MMTVNIQDQEVSKNRFLLYIAMFLLASALFLYEIILTRLFSVILTFNLVFLIVSSAILGSGLGGIWVFSAFKKGKYSSPRELLTRTSIWLCLSIPITIGIIYFLPFIPFFSIYAVIGSIPFMVGGVVISCLFKEKSDKSSKLYFMDLIGSAFGSVGAISLLNSLGFMRSVVVISSIIILAGILICVFYKETKRVTVMIIGLLLLGGSLIQGEVIGQLEKNFNAYFSNSHKIIGYLRNTSEKPLGISFTKWDSISRTDVIETTNRNEKLIVTDGGGTAPIIKFDGNLNNIQHLKNDVNYIPFSFGDNKRTLLIGSGGGKDVLFALLGGNKEIHAVEINKSTLDAVEYFKDFSGDIYGNPGVEVHNQDGRNYIENSNMKYDNIYLSMVMTNAIENTTYSLSENYLYTYEAFEKYFDAIRNNGKLSFMTHSTLDLSKIANTGIKVLLDRGVPQDRVTDYFVVINGADKEHQNTHKTKVSMPLIIFKNKPFTSDELLRIRDTAADQNREILHDGIKVDGIYKLLAEKKITFEEMIDTIPFNAAPITDNSPFFYRHTKWFPREISLVLLGALGVWLFLYRKYFKNKDGVNAQTYFIGLGIGFMLVEIPMIQKMTLYFGNPSLAFSVILFVVLLSCGIGSGLSETKVMKKITRNSPVYLISASIMIIITQLNMKTILTLTNQFTFMQKAIVILVMFLPVGIFMGMAFPTGLKALKRLYGSDETIPLMWGVNGIFSVVGSTLAIMISMLFGFDTTIYVGAGIYLILYVLNPLKIQNV